MGDGVTVRGGVTVGGWRDCCRCDGWGGVMVEGGVTVEGGVSVGGSMTLWGKRDS